MHRTIFAIFYRRGLTLIHTDFSSTEGTEDTEKR